MLWSVAIALVLAGAVAALNRFVASPLARVVIHYQNGTLTLKRGVVPPQQLVFVRDLLRSTRVKRASVAILPTGRLWFSPSIPQSIHQQLRNVLMP